MIRIEKILKERLSGMEDFGKGMVPVGHFDAYITMKDPSKAEQVAKWARGHMKMNKELGIEHQDMSVESVDTDTGVVHLRGVAWTLSNFLNSIDGSDVDGTVSHEPPASLAETANPVRLKKSELIDIILEEVEAALTDEATSLGQKDPKYKKFPSTIFYADVADEYKAILPAVEKLLEENPQDRPYIADALEMMMFNVRDGIHGPELEEARYISRGTRMRRGGGMSDFARKGRGAPRMNKDRYELFLQTGDTDHIIQFDVSDIRKAVVALGLKGDEAIMAMMKGVRALRDKGILDERAPDNELSPEEKVRQAKGALRGSKGILIAYGNKDIDAMKRLMPQDMGVEKSAWITLMADLEGRPNEEESE
jgi:hypothetical protein